MRRDELPDMAFLETDTTANVRFYRRFGFEVVEEGSVIDVPFWYMERRRDEGGNSVSGPPRR